MAFQNKNLAVIAYANGFTYWHYNAREEVIEDIDGKNFFGPIWTLAALGDVFLITDKNGRTHQRQIIELGNEKCIVGKLD